MAKHKIHKHHELAAEHYDQAAKHQIRFFTMCSLAMQAGAQLVSQPPAPNLPPPMMRQ
jgi:hypothetical protein